MIFFTKDPESDFFIKNPNLTKQIWRWERRGWGLLEKVIFLRG